MCIIFVMSAYNILNIINIINIINCPIRIVINILNIIIVIPEFSHELHHSSDCAHMKTVESVETKCRNIIPLDPGWILVGSWLVDSGNSRDSPISHNPQLIWRVVYMIPKRSSSTHQGFCLKKKQYELGEVDNHGGEKSRDNMGFRVTGYFPYLGIQMR